MFEFDEAFYLEKYPDVANAVSRGEWTSGFSHYCAVGKAKGRIGVSQIDADWYLTSYPRAVEEIAAGLAVTPSDHFHRIGRFRGYLPSLVSRRVENPCAHRSRYGGLWTDVVNALDVIAGRAELEKISPDEAKLLRKWVLDGYVILPGAVPSEILTRAESELNRAYSGSMEGLRFAIHGIGQNTDWIPEAKTKPAKAIDIHWLSEDVRELIFSDVVLNFLHLIFERRVLASQTLGFWRGSAQEAHQDSAYVNYSLPMQFAASWIALEDVKEGAGELFYYSGSHRMPEFTYGGRYKGAEEAKRVNPDLDLTNDYSRHLDLIEKQATGISLSKEKFLARRGDALIWSADLAHGGGAISSSQTRKSIVTHYCPADVAPQYFETKSRPIVRSFGSRAYYSSALYV